jgi:hypothetical protein
LPQVVKAIEACGARSGETAFDVMIADCGELPKGEARAGGAVVKARKRGARGGGGSRGARQGREARAWCGRRSSVGPPGMLSGALKRSLLDIISRFLGLKLLTACC